MPSWGDGGPAFWDLLIYFVMTILKNIDLLKYIFVFRRKKLIWVDNLFFFISTQKLDSHMGKIKQFFELSFNFQCKCQNVIECVVQIGPQ